MEAAQFAIRFSPTVQRFYQRKLARACYYSMRDLVPFDVHKAFG